MQFFGVGIVLLLFLFCGCLLGDDDAMPSPFYRILQLQMPRQTGSDVFILQNLIIRSPFVTPIQTDAIYGQATANAVGQFQVLKLKLHMKSLITNVYK
jgi:hypothetical protein